MATSHLLLAFVVILVWGFNFLFVKMGLEEMSPYLLCTLRFMLASVPLIFFVKRPRGTEFLLVAAYGVVMFAIQFSLLFLGMSMGMPAGMASLLMQTQVFFSIFFAVLFLGEQPHLIQILGALVACLGIGVVGLHFDGEMSLAGFVFVLLGAATWGVGNLITKKLKDTHFIQIIAWGSFVAIFPMVALTLSVDGLDATLDDLNHLSIWGYLSLAYIVYASTWLGYGIWNWLVSMYPVGIVVPFTLLIPVVAMMSSVVFFHEPLYSWKLLAGFLVMLGLSINVLGPKVLQRLNHRER